MVKKINQQDKSYSNKILTSSMLGFGLENMDVMFLAFALSSIINEFHITSAEAGLISSITNFGMLFGGVIFGVLADKYGRIRIFTYTIFLFAIATALLSIAHNIYIVYILRFIAGMGGGGEFGIGMALVAEVFAMKKLGRVSSVVAIGGQVGALTAALLAAAILPLWGWRALFLIGVIPVILAFYIRRNLDETDAWKRTKAKQTLEKKENSPITLLFNSKNKAHTTIALTIMSSVQVAGYFGLMNWLPSILQKQHGLSVSNSSLWTISTIIGMSLGMLCFGQILDKFGAKISYSIFLIASAASVFLYVFAQSSIALLIGGAFVGFFVNGMFAGYGAVISSFYPTHIRSTANNVIFNVGRAVGGLSPIAIGFLMDHSGMLGTMIFLACLYMISLVMLLSLKHIPLRGKRYLENA
ncbi:MFS transporter [Staphylococcus carnosus]|uniref:Transporter protein n=1 Tax=Staphylococcus carnosus (strain TM300) TaxID=396513 RepID=B9DIQ0_STACT|nr:MFS transporter [Staphylococcus carnosus]KOR14018.1 MFS transporter [Staphylococcus carnosus]QPT03699.1 MFS transporter [Staphylococcus carnosus]UQA66423.1 MFS transporter [Staphylococcus carnosus]UTB78745.1 MFS transporter [Staphylococcus carnosus]UTB88295.1 MFS transporter [Staphylococcus carnosus]